MEHITVVDFGSADGWLIAKFVRELGAYCEIVSYDVPAEKISAKSPKGLILSGETEEAGVEAAEAADTFRALNIPTLEIHSFGSDCKDKTKEEIIKNFIFCEAKCAGGWSTSVFVEETVRELKEKIGNKNVLCGLSGGVDSTVTAALISKAVGKQLTCIFVDHGLMRKNEGDEIERIFSRQFDANFVRADCQDLFLLKLKGITDPETKRKIIGEEFIRVFEAEARKTGSLDFLAQGTIYPDIVESGTKTAALVKSHHNVGGLPETLDFKEIIEPLQVLFKDEVRNVGRELGLPDFMVDRQPFPGPGLAVRVLGEITKEKLDILREADYIFRDEIEKSGANKGLWQYFAILTGLRSVGVKNHTRTYGYTVALRAVNSADAMSASWARIPYDVLDKVSERITAEVEQVTRIVYDITAKPPATIEWE